MTRGMWRTSSRADARAAASCGACHVCRDEPPTSSPRRPGTGSSCTSSPRSLRCFRKSRNSRFARSARRPSRFCSSKAMGSRRAFSTPFAGKSLRIVCIPLKSRSRPSLTSRSSGPTNDGSSFRASRFRPLAVSSPHDGDTLKILYLVPQPNRPDRIGAYTFLDEEIQALAAAGVDAHVLSTAVPEDTWCGKVRLRSVDARSALVSRARAAAFLMRRLEDVPRQNVLLPRLWHFLARLEYIATELVKEENFDLIHSHFAWPVGFGGALARAATGRPLIASLRGTDILM